MTGAAKSLANSYDNGEQLSLGVIGNALGEGVKGAAIGAVAGFAIGGALAATAVASPFLAGAAGVGLAGYGLYNSATSAFENLQEGRYASFGVDVVTGLLDAKGLQHGVSHSVSAAKSGKFYNNSTQWDGAAWDSVRGYENQSSGLTRDAITSIRQNTLGYEHGELMSNGWTAGMGPGAASRGEFRSNSGGRVFDEISDPWLIDTSPSFPSDRRRFPTGERSLIPINDGPQGKNDIHRENASAFVLSRAGYKVMQNPIPEQLAALGYEYAGTKNPDYLIEGKVFDHYVPRENTVPDVRKGIHTKVVKDKQTQRVVVDVGVSTVNIDYLKNNLTKKPMTGLEEVIFIRDGKIIDNWTKTNVRN